MQETGNGVNGESQVRQPIFLFINYLKKLKDMESKTNSMMKFALMFDLVCLKV
jgi:hypothetical protein